MRQGRVVRPEGNRAILLTDWRPDRLHRPHFARLGGSTFYSPISPFRLCRLPALALRCAPSTFHLACLIFSPLPPSLPPNLHACPSPPTPPYFSSLPSATRHSQMSAGSCITETARLSAVVTWHLKAVCAWDTVASHSTLIAACY